MPEDYNLLYEMANKDFFAIQRKNQSKFLVGVKAMYENRCYKDISSSDKFENFMNYWQSA